MSWGAVAGGAIVAGAGLLKGKMESDAAKSAASAQSKGTTAALQEEQRQFDQQMQEYQRKQAMLEQQQGQIIQQNAPYVQGGQEAFYNMLALSGLAAPAGATTPTATRTVQGVNLPSSVSPQDVAAELGKGGLSLMSDRWSTVQSGAGGARQIAAQLVQQTQAQHPDWTTQQINDEVNAQLANVPEASTLPTVANAANPYAGMTGAEAQQTAVENIASSPLLQELTRQGEEAMLQQAAATGGLRGGNTQAALAQFRPQMLQNEIDKQYARLSGLSGMGMQATASNPLTNPGAMPSSSNIGQYMSDIGAINAGSALAQGQAAGQAIGSIAGGIGYGLNQYLNRPQTSTNIGSGQGGMQVVGFDSNGNPIMQ